MVIKLLRVVLPVILLVGLMVIIISQSADTSSEPVSSDAVYSDWSPAETASMETASIGTASIGTASIGTASMETVTMETASIETASAGTAAFAETEEGFSGQRAALEQRVAAAYDKLFSTLSKHQQLYLQEAQTAWQDCYESFAAALKVQLDVPVTVPGDIEGEEREANLYRDTVLMMLDERAADLESWAGQDFRQVGADQVAELKKQIRAEKSVLAYSFSMNIVYLDEGFRQSWQEAQNSWYAFQASNTTFISAATRSNGAAMAAEELFQLDRMSNLTLLHQKGILYFRNEKEE